MAASGVQFCFLVGGSPPRILPDGRGGAVVQRCSVCSSAMGRVHWCLLVLAAVPFFSHAAARSGRRRLLIQVVWVSGQKGQRAGASETRV